MNRHLIDNNSCLVVCCFNGQTPNSWKQFLKVVLIHASTKWTIYWKQNTDRMLRENLKQRNEFSVLVHKQYKYIEL